MLSQADPRRNASLGVAAATYDPARPVAVGIPATAFLPSLVLTAFLSDANAIYTTVAIACSQTLADLTPFGLVLVIRAKIAMPASSCADHTVRNSDKLIILYAVRKTNSAGAEASRTALTKSRQDAVKEASPERLPLWALAKIAN
jgi:hypothetical protein